MAMSSSSSSYLDGKLPRQLPQRSEISPLSMAAEIARPVGKGMSLSKLVEERAVLKEKEKKQERNMVPDLPKDCIYNILIKLSAESLQRSRFVCRTWYNLINSSYFMKTFLHHSEKVLMFQSSIPEERSVTFCVEEKLQGPMYMFHISDFLARKKKSCMHIMVIKDGMSEVLSQNTCCFGKILGSCNGLLLLENSLKIGGTIVMNPVTKEVLALPVGTMFPQHEESYGIAFDSSTEEYKVVHLFMDDMGYVGCEILTIGSRSWKAINGPSYGMFGWFGYEPVSSIGALHWVPRIDSDYIVSMGMEDEKFRQILLPTDWRNWDGLVVMGECLSYFNHVNPTQIDVWIMKDMNSGSWIKQHSITKGCVLDMFPIGCSRNGEGVVLSREEDNSFYVYDFEMQRMKKIESMNKHSSLYGSYIPHVNTIVSWRKNRYQWEEVIW